MIASGIRCKVLITQLVRENPKDLKEWSLGQADWSFLAQLYTALHPFYDFTKLSLDDGVTIGTVKAHTLSLQPTSKRSLTAKESTVPMILALLMHSNVRKCRRSLQNTELT
jgi:hypothetical protein